MLQAVELLCEYDGDRSPSFPTGGAKVKGNLHWVSGSAPGQAPLSAEVRSSTHLFALCFRLLCYLLRTSLWRACEADPQSNFYPLLLQVRLYDYLFTTEDPGSSGDWEAELNPLSEVRLQHSIAHNCSLASKELVFFTTASLYANKYYIHPYLLVSRVCLPACRWC